MKFKPVVLVLFLILPTLVMAQDGKPRAIEPIRATIVTRADNSDIDRELHKAFCAELNKRRDVAIGSHKAEWKLYLGITGVTIDGKPRGYAGAVMLIDKGGEVYWLSVKTHSTVEGLARDFVEALDEDVFKNLQLAAEKEK